jgi:hypothetical protein
MKVGELKEIIKDLSDKENINLSEYAEEDNFIDPDVMSESNKRTIYWIRKMYERGTTTPNLFSIKTNKELAFSGEINNKFFD